MSASKKWKTTDIIFVLCGLCVCWGLYSLTRQADESAQRPLYKVNAVSPLPIKPKLAEASIKSESNKSHSIVGETSNSKPAILMELERESKLVGDLTDDPNAIEIRIRQRAQQLSKEELQVLEETSVNEANDQDERLMAVYYLMKAGPKAHNNLQALLYKDSAVLKKIGAPHSHEEARYGFEMSLRTMALQALEDNVQASKGRLKIRNESFRQTQLDNSYLQGLLKIALIGEANRRPLLREFIDRNLSGGTL